MPHVSQTDERRKPLVKSCSQILTSKILDFSSASGRSCFSVNTALRKNEFKMHEGEVVQLVFTLPFDPTVQ